MVFSCCELSSHVMSCHCHCHGRDGDWTSCYRVQRSSASQTRTETDMLHDSCRGRVSCFPFFAHCFPFSAPCLPFPGMLREGGTQPPFSSLPVSSNASLHDEGQLAVGTRPVCLECSQDEHATAPLELRLQLRRCIDCRPHPSRAEQGDRRAGRSAG
jgi:hypothetical protein